uniref:Nudix hydrolase domain-containing protein n=1 Tax=viral metagenome TaxID=1070528 RepID=A0A6C0K3T9_9ZZZZ
MGAGILPTCIHKNKLYFLFGKEHDYCDTPGWSDFGGGTDDSETYIQTAIREGGEELTGFLGSDADLSKMLKRNGVFIIDYNSDGHSTYRMHIFKMNYDEALPYYYNNNQRFLQKRLDPAIIKQTKIFEKAQIRWMCIDELPKMHKEFRSYFQDIVDMICDKKSEIFRFINKGSNKQTRGYYSKKNYTRKHKKRG